MDSFTAPWPGPGNSEGSPDPEGWPTTPLPDNPEDQKNRDRQENQGRPDPLLASLVVDTPWPGPGDSEG